MATPFKFQEFFRRISEAFPHSIYLDGNHEHYHHDYQKTDEVLAEALSQFSNIYHLEKQTKVIDDVVFVGGTLWTDMGRENPVTMQYARYVMNDFRVVANTPEALLTPQDVVGFHKETLEFLTKVVDDERKNPGGARKIVVCSHHAPSFQSIDPSRYHDRDIDPAYASDLQDFILDRPEIKLWTHGHIHKGVDYMIGTTRIVSNPRGYANSPPEHGGNRQFNPTHFVEI